MTEDQKKTLVIPTRLQKKNYRFIKTYNYNKETRDQCLKKLKNPKITEAEKKKILALYNKPKRPLEDDWTKENNYRWNEPEFQKYLKNATGYGVITGSGNLTVVDSDHPAVKELMKKHLPQTLTVKTGAGKGHFHFYFECKIKDKIVLKDDEKEHHYGEVQWQGQQVIGPGSIHPSGNKYTIVRDLPIAKITAKKLITALKPFLTTKDLKTYFKHKDEEIIEDESPYETISIKPLLKRIKGLTRQGDEYTGSHPVHGSTTGRNFSINVEKNTFFCFRCNSGGSTITLVAILEKIISCEDVKSLTGKKLLKAEKIAAKKYGIKTKKDIKEAEGIVNTQLDFKTVVTLTPRGIVLNRLAATGHWWRQKVYIGRFEPKQKLIVDEDTAIRYNSSGRELIDDFTGITKRMKKEGGVVSKKDIENCVNAVCIKLPKKRGHATYGVYEKNDKLTLCMDSLPLKDAQQKAKIQCKDALTQEMAKDTIKHYIEMLSHWHPYEILPSMGMGVIAPFALTLRKKNYFVYNIVHFSPLSKLGKSTVHHIFSRYLFTIFPISGNSIESPFRFSAILDSICGFISIDEAENVNWKRTSDLLKESPENYISNVRGTSDQGINTYLSRGVFGINCNRFAIADGPTLVRILKIEFDGALVSQRGGNPKKVDELKHIMNKLKPIGWRLVELELESLNYSFAELARRIDHHEAELKKVYENFLDPRRVMTYAVIYEGLKVWELAATKYGIEWHAPPYQEFADNVIDKIERTTEESGELSIYDFVHWFEMWKVKNTRKVQLEKGGSYAEIIGEDIIWRNHELKTGEKKYPGSIITGTILREYKGDKQSRIDSMSDIASAVGQLTGIPKKDLYKTLKVGGATQRIVFIPSDIWKFKDGQSKLTPYLTPEQKNLKEKIKAGEKKGEKIDLFFLRNCDNTSVIYDAQESGLLIKNKDKDEEYTWSD